MDKVIDSGVLGGVMGSALARKARGVGSNPALGAIFLLFNYTQISTSLTYIFIWILVCEYL